MDRGDQNEITAHLEQAHRPFLFLYHHTKWNDKQKWERIHLATEDTVKLPGHPVKRGRGTDGLKRTLCQFQDRKQRQNGFVEDQGNERRDTMYFEMKVKFLTFDSTSNGFVVLLMDLSNKTGLPIWIGPFEANAIAMKLKKMGSHRPSTHDLINNILKTLESRVVKIVVNDLKENTYYALIYLNRGGEEIIIDSRPSDAMAIALAVDAPIFVSEQVIEKARTIDMEKEGDHLKEWLESLNPDDFKFKA